MTATPDITHATAPAERLAMATQFKVGEIYGTEVLIDLRGGGLWAVTCSPDCLTSDGKWVVEPRPSSRSDDFLADTRFTLDEAFRLAAHVLTDAQRDDGGTSPPKMRTRSNRGEPK